MTIATGPDGDWTCEGQADLLDELEATRAGGGWERHAYRAATDRLAVPGRTLDAGFVAGLEVDAIETARQTGEDPQGALDGLHRGLAAAVAPPCPACGAQGRHGRHDPSCTDPWSSDGRVYPLTEAS